MLFLLKALFIASLVRLLLKTNQPAWCAIVYVVLSTILGLMFGRTLLFALIAAPISFVLAFAYFWLLNKFEESGLFWIILVGGLLIGLV